MWCVEPKQFHDVVGYYNRFDIFDLSVNRRGLSAAFFTGDVGARPALAVAEPGLGQDEPRDGT